MSIHCVPEACLQGPNSYYYTALNTANTELSHKTSEKISVKDLPEELLTHIFSYINCGTLSEIHPVMLVCKVFYKHILDDPNLCLNLSGIREQKKFQIISTIREGRLRAREHRAYESTSCLTKHIYNLFYEINFGCFESLPTPLYVSSSTLVDGLSAGLYSTCIESAHILQDLRFLKSNMCSSNRELIRNRTCYIEKNILLKYTSTRNRFHEITGIPRPLTYFVGPLLNEIFLLNAIQSNKQIGVYNILDQKVAGLRLLPSQAGVENNKSYSFLFIPHGSNFSGFQWDSVKRLDLRNEDEELRAFIERIASGEMDKTIFTQNVPTVLVVFTFDTDLFELSSIFNEAFTFPKNPKFYSSPEHKLIHKLVTSIAEQLKHSHQIGESISNHEALIDELCCTITIKTEVLTEINLPEDTLLIEEYPNKAKNTPQYSLNIETSKGIRRPPIDMLNFEVIREIVLSRPEYKTLSIECNVEGDIKFLP